MRKIKQFRLRDVTRVMDVEERNRMILAAYGRILAADSRNQLIFLL